MKVLRQSLETAARLRSILFLTALTYVATYLAGSYMVQLNIPSAVKLSKSTVETLSVEPIFVPVIGALRGGNLMLAIAYTFLINLLGGAFATTTLPGVIPLIGGVGSMLVSGVRGFLLGAVFQYAGIYRISPGYTTLVVGTLILELGAYVFSTAAGVNISLSTVFPRRYGVGSRLSAFKQAWKDALKIYLIVIILLAVGAVWEMTGIYLSTQR
jgi:uncharacterized membrane protein SpoIIM required for sporulation